MLNQQVKLPTFISSFSYAMGKEMVLLGRGTLGAWIMDNVADSPTVGKMFNTRTEGAWRTDLNIPFNAKLTQSNVFNIYFLKQMQYE